MIKDSLRPTWIEINLRQLRENLENIRAQVAPAKVMVVLKANAYGHGVNGVAPYIVEYADHTGVALVEEGIQLRQMGIKKPILVMGGTLPEQIPLFTKHGLTLTVPSLEILQAAEEAAKTAGNTIKIHIKIDTGMERIGVREYEAEPLLAAAYKCKHLEVEGIYTHFANSEIPDLTHAKLQLERFHEVLRFYEKHSLPPPPIRHTASSGAILQLPESYFEMVRPGILFYGVYPDKKTERTIEVRPALTWYSRITYTKITQPGRPVSYGSLWHAEHPTRIVTIPCGYADGYFRRMTNQAKVILNGKKYPQVGRICMDQFMVNVGHDEGRQSDIVTLLGEANDQKITAEDLAEWAGTNPYEILTNISARVPRVFISDNA